MRFDVNPDNDSTCVFFVEANKIVVLSSGSTKSSNGARTIFFNELLNLVAEKYPSLRVDEIRFGSVFVNSLALLNLTETLSIRTGCSASIAALPLSYRLTPRTNTVILVRHLQTWQIALRYQRNLTRN